MPPERVLIAGVTGAGKTTLARRLAAQWYLRHVELDALYHGPDWTPRPDFLDDVRAFAAEDRWVTEWQYTSKGTDSILPPRAQLVLWLDYPYRVVRTRLLRRTISRHVRHTELWNGNTERGIAHLFDRDPDNNILLWQARTMHTWAERMPRMRERFPHLEIVRFAHPRDAERWLRSPGSFTPVPERGAPFVSLRSLRNQSTRSLSEERPSSRSARSGTEAPGP